MFPIVQRELQVAARRSGAYRVRFTTGTVAAGLGGLFLLGTALPGGGVGGVSGRALFGWLSGLDLGLALLAGVLLTADCISRERREGTLGFLFLTDLSGRDVVAGKFAALGLVPLQGLLATLPVAGMAVFLGGVTAGEFWRVLLALLNAMFLALALGMWVSSLVSDDRQAVGIALGGMVMAVGLPEVLAQAARIVPRVPTVWSQVGLAGPIGWWRGAFDDSYRLAPKGFWLGMVYGQAVGWLLLASAAWMVHRSWREVDPGPTKAAARTGEGSGPAGRAGAGGTRPGAWERVNGRRRRRLLREGPLGWATAQNAWVRGGVWWVVAVTGGCVVLTFGVSVMTGRGGMAGREAGVVALLGWTALKVLMAIQAVYGLQDACRSGAMELLLITPATSRRLLDSHLAALRSLFLWPFLVLALMQVALGLATNLAMGGDWPSRSTQVGMGMGRGLVESAIHGLDLVAVAYHASRWGLEYDRPMRALLRTMLVVVLLPLLFCGHGRVLVDLVVMGQNRAVLERFRERVRRWYFPGPAEETFGSPRVG